MSIGVSVIVALAAGCATDPAPPSLIGDWRVSEKDGQVATELTVFTFTDQVFVIGVDTDAGCCLHSDSIPYTVDTSVPLATLDHQGNSDFEPQLGIFQFADPDTVDWKLTATEQLRATDFAPEPGYELYRLERLVDGIPP